LTTGIGSTLQPIGRPRTKPVCTTKGEVYDNYPYNTARTVIQKQAHKNYEKSGKPYICFFCGYDKYAELAHRVPIKDFPMDALLSDINHIDNLVTLCPNHHREADAGLIDLVAAKNIEPRFFGRVLPVPHIEGEVHHRRRSSNPKGSVLRRPRAKGPDVWVYFFRQFGKQKTYVIGDVLKYQTQDEARYIIEQIKKMYPDRFRNR